MNSQRARRVGQLMKEEISAYLLRDLKDPLPGFTTVTNVIVAQDMSTADVLISVYGEEAEQEATIAQLVEEGWRIRQSLGRKMRMKRIPELRFELDKGMERADRITELLSGIDIPPAPEEPEDEAV